MNKLKNNVIRSIPNLHQEMKLEQSKILSAIKPNELQEPKTAKYMELDLKNKINFSIRENITSLSSERQQPKKIKKIDGKVATIVELIKQDLLPMLNIQNDRIEKLERRIRTKNESEGDSDLRKSSLISDKKSNSVVENEVQNLSVSVDEIKKNLSHLDNFVKYQFIKRKCQGSEVQNDTKNKSAISQIQAKLNTEIIQQKIETQQTTKQIQEYITVQLQEIKEWINKISIEQQKEIEVKLNLMETQFYQFLYQPFEVLRQIQTNQSDVQSKIKEFESIINSNIFQSQIQNSQEFANCCKENHNNKRIIKINCGHFYHEECLQTQMEEDLKEQRIICCKRMSQLDQVKQNPLNKSLKGNAGSNLQRVDKIVTEIIETRYNIMLEMWIFVHQRLILPSSRNQLQQS
ncbi:unnamed protein product (macronuclear) [Paramecium tetraurelia]|uniref:RING-type domain-containing protein n=1 Tax=Paramecium tetraurelia TaxID=5888 RepID=A0C3U8_PARTE|nr:uncharacterized protein GSPATT00034944001 [Paramecium tetraurelia]CAK65465.1 unnamed protein product [Paramecium tetraurelia]|eukprot:XP_001432862.1 hypothetical protein (macronuclear) [Paramecium tetraurelia strain d4-2]